MLYNQVLTQEPKIVNLNEKNDFEYLYVKKLDKNIADIVLS